MKMYRGYDFCLVGCRGSWRRGGLLDFRFNLYFNLRVQFCSQLNDEINNDYIFYAVSITITGGFNTFCCSVELDRNGFSRFSRGF